MIAEINQWLDNLLSNGYVLGILFVLWLVFCIQKRIRILVYLRRALMIGSFFYLLAKANFVFDDMIMTWLEIWAFTYIKWFIALLLLKSFDSGLFGNRR